jgi:methylated-DNA-[protein]-cysteine S-methyltransferase
MQQHYHTFYSSPLGILKICATDTYISEVTFLEEGQPFPEMGDSKEMLNNVLQQCVEQFIEYFQGFRRQFEIPVAQTGTEFQQRVWSELIGIPFGKTISYKDLSKRLGDPKVIRAAASTNGKNKIAIIVPCHRVIGTNSELVGYAGGLWRKKWLLAHENKVAHGVLTLF